MNVIKFPGLTKGHVLIKDALSSAEENCKELLILGVDHNDDFYFACTSGDPHLAVYLSQLFTHKMLNGDFTEEGER